VVQDAREKPIALLKKFPASIRCKKEIDSLALLQKAELTHAKGPKVLGTSEDCILYAWIEGGSLIEAPLVPAAQLGRATGELGLYNPTRAQVSPAYLHERAKRLSAVLEMNLRTLHDQGLTTTVNERTFRHITADAFRTGARAGLVHEDTHLGNWMNGKKLTLIDTAGLLRSVDSAGIPRGLPAIDMWGTAINLRTCAEIQGHSPATIERLLTSFRRGYQETYHFRVPLEMDRFAQFDREVWQLYFVMEHAASAPEIVAKSLRHIEEQFGPIHVPRRRR
jgi:hypothetical protein